MCLDVMPGECLAWVEREAGRAAQVAAPSEFLQHPPRIRHNGGMVQWGLGTMKGAHLTSRRIYRVDPLVQTYAKEPSSNFKKLAARYKRLINGKRFQAAFPRYGNHPLVEGNGGGSYAYIGGGHSNGRAISLGSNRDEAVLLHEIAHHVAYRHSQYGPGDDHGPGFCAALLDVVRVAQGAEAEKALRHLYSALGLKVYRNGRVGRVRAPGDAPEKARPVIEEIVGGKQAAAAERARARAMVRGRGERIVPPEGVYYSSIKYAAPCECGAVGEVMESYWTRTTEEWTARCEACGLIETVRFARGKVAAR